MSNSLLEKLEQSFVFIKEMQNPAEYTVKSISLLSPDFLNALSENKITDYIEQLLSGVNEVVTNIKLSDLFDFDSAFSSAFNASTSEKGKIQDINRDYLFRWWNIFRPGLDSIFRLLVAEQNLQKINGFYVISDKVITMDEFKDRVKSQIQSLKSMMFQLKDSLWDELVNILMNPDESFSSSEKRIIDKVKKIKLVV